MFDSKSKPQRRRILLVEDEEHLARGIKFNLQAEGYEVEHVGDGGSAVRTVQSATPPFDLIVLDLMLPGMSGYAVCESLLLRRSSNAGADPQRPNASEDRTRGFDVGADQYLTKPFDLDELLSRVKNLLTRLRTTAAVRRPPGSGPPQPTFAFGKVRINFDTFEADVGGEPVRLTFLEMQLLKYFIANEGRVIPRNELIENVWQMPEHQHPGARPVHPPAAEGLRARRFAAAALLDDPRRRVSLRLEA